MITYIQCISDCKPVNLQTSEMYVYCYAKTKLKIYTKCHRIAILFCKMYKLL